MNMLKEDWEDSIYISRYKTTDRIMTGKGLSIRIILFLLSVCIKILTLQKLTRPQVRRVLFSIILFVIKGTTVYIHMSYCINYCLLRSFGAIVISSMSPVPLSCSLNKEVHLINTNTIADDESIGNSTYLCDS